MTALCSRPPDHALDHQARNRAQGIAYCAGPRRFNRIVTVTGGSATLRGSPARYLLGDRQFYADMATQGLSRGQDLQTGAGDAALGQVAGVGGMTDRL